MILLVARVGEDIIPSGGTVLQVGDELQVLAPPEFVAAGRLVFAVAE
ncbi:MAG: hypothetical protein P4M01_07495 [Acidobacteriota bacterium]|nr:hypothetical protein [Acidobacteriota bacterium]